MKRHEENKCMLLTGRSHLGKISSYIILNIQHSKKANYEGSKDQQFPGVSGDGGMNRQSIEVLGHQK